MNENYLGIYVHIPFCKKKCKYCDFISFENKENCFNEYVNKIISEIDFYFEKDTKKSKEIDFSFLDKRKINTIYFGGGTPSIIDSKLIEKILIIIREKFIVLEDAEITLEVNPGTVNKEKLEDYKRIGINRLSIGLQSAENRLLSLIGRIHTYEKFLETYNLAREIGFNNINVDLMFALPTQTMDELVQSLIKVVNLNPEHISIYSLILEEGTVLAEEIENNKYSLLDEELERKMYTKIKRFLAKNKYEHYEISNFSKEGYRSSHNENCWNQNEYLGLGIAAHSYLNNIRYSNTKLLDNYLNNSFDEIYEVEEKQFKEDKVREYMILKLRMLEGVKISEFENIFGINPLLAFRFEIEKLTKQDLIEIDLDNIKLTEKGLDLANQVFAEFV